jgi:predicted metal-dependent hydrolase
MSWMRALNALGGRPAPRPARKPPAARQPEATKARKAERETERGERFILAAETRFPVRIVDNPRARRLTLRILPGGAGLSLTVPPHVGERQIDEFLDRHRLWAQTRLARQPAPVVAAAGQAIPFLGVEHRIELTGRLRGLVQAVTRDGEAVLLVPGEASSTPRRVEDYLKRRARSELDAAVQRHAATLGVRPRRIRLTDTTSRWGSCSSTRTLSFSWRIVMAPPEVLDYLVAHEVAHLRELNHSSAFWQIVRQLCPHMERHRAWLRNHGHTLHVVRFGSD